MRGANAGRLALAGQLVVAAALSAGIGLAAGAVLVTAASAPAFAKQARLVKPVKPADPAAGADDPSGDSLPADGSVGSGDDAMDGAPVAPKGKRAVDTTGSDDASGVVADPSGGVETLDGDVDNPDGSGDSAAGGQPMKLSPGAGGAAARKKVLLAPPALGPVADGPPLSFTLEARLTEKSPPLTRGLSWRIFDAAPSADGKLKLVGEAHGGGVRLMLKPGSYFVYASYGRASAMSTIT